MSGKRLPSSGRLGMGSSPGAGPMRSPAQRKRARRLAEPDCPPGGPWYGPRAVRGPRVIGFRFALAALSLSVPLAGCGGDRQDKHEPSGDFPVSIVSASFPANQSLSQATKMSISVRNDGSQALPDLAVTVNSFDYVKQRAGLADPNRPIWIVDQGPQGGETAYVNTWTLGTVPPGQVRTFIWRVTPVLAGRHRIDYRVAAGLNGKARAKLAGGGVPQGSFTVNVSDQPPQAQVDPRTGRVVRVPAKGSTPSSGAPGPAAASHGTQGSNDSQPGSGGGSSPGAGAGAQPGSP